MLPLLTYYNGAIEDGSSMLHDYKYEKPLGEYSDEVDLHFYFKEFMPENDDQSSTYHLTKVATSKIVEDIPETVEYVALQRVTKIEWDEDDFTFGRKCDEPSPE